MDFRLKSRKIVPLGSAFPGPLLFPLDSLRKAQSSSTRSLGIWSTFDDLPPGNERLRRQVGKRYLTQGLSVAADEIVLTNGALEALNFCLQAVARPGDAVVVEFPPFTPRCSRSSGFSSRPSKCRRTRARVWTSPDWRTFWRPNGQKPAG